ncbi:MAG: phosphate acyltransferase PlsX [Clostridia bacterium]|nr:phosphate acyltransferase PlsX [Clostridia bacterium]
MRIIIDVMSGDNAPLEMVKGAVMARDEIGVSVTMVGNREIIEKIAEEEQLNLTGIEIEHTDVVIDMEDSALSVVREKNHSSMALGLQLLARGEGDAFVSAGNTGALLAGATLIVRRIKGIHRAAIGTVLPFPTPVLLLDAGANIEVDAKTLEQFAVMGTAYMKNVFDMQHVRVGLLNNGTEPTKGTQVYKDANLLLSQSEAVEFAGNVEAKEVPFDVCDVLVCDGFVGNIFLKSIEGLGKFFMATLKNLFYENLLTKTSAFIIKGKVKNLKNQFDASERGGAPLLGISKPVIKAHGSSDARAIMNAAKQAKLYLDTGVIYDIAKHAGSLLNISDNEEKTNDATKSSEGKSNT